MLLTYWGGRSDDFPGALEVGDLFLSGNKGNLGFRHNLCWVSKYKQVIGQDHKRLPVVQNFSQMIFIIKFETAYSGK